MTLFDFIVVERTDDENLKTSQGKFNSNIDALVQITAMIFIKMA